MTTNNVQLPNVTIISRKIDWTDTKRPALKFDLLLTNGDKTMITEYGGGIAAFLPKGFREKLIKENLNRHSGGQTERAAIALLGGKNLVFNLGVGNDVAVQAVELILRNAVMDQMGVMHSLVMDAQAGDESFEEFCSNLGYDEDSRKAESIHRACQDIGKKFRQLVGKDFDAIEEMMRDY